MRAMETGFSTPSTLRANHHTEAARKHPEDIVTHPQGRPWARGVAQFCLGAKQNQQVSFSSSPLQESNRKACTTLCVPFVRPPNTGSSYCSDTDEGLEFELT